MGQQYVFPRLNEGIGRSRVLKGAHNFSLVRSKAVDKLKVFSNGIGPRDI